MISTHGKENIVMNVVENLRKWRDYK